MGLVVVVVVAVVVAVVVVVVFVSKQNRDNNYIWKRDSHFHLSHQLITNNKKLI